MRRGQCDQVYSVLLLDSDNLESVPEMTLHIILMSGQQVSNGSLGRSNEQRISRIGLCTQTTERLHKSSYRQVWKNTTQPHRATLALARKKQARLFGWHFGSFASDGVLNSLQLFKQLLTARQCVTGFTRTRASS